MNWMLAPTRWFPLLVVLLDGLGLILAAGPGMAQEDKKPKTDAQRAAEMVDALVNRNKAPKIVGWPPKSPDSAALFPEDHDWVEEGRVSKAIGALVSDQTDQVWEEMVKRCRDKRYCRTVTDVDTGNPRVKTVGSVCGQLAHSRLTGVFWQHLPNNPCPAKDGQRLYVSAGVGELSEWRKQRAGKALYELQIEVCEKAIQKVQAAAGVPEAAREKTRKKIEAEIAKLRQSKQPAHVRRDDSFEVGGKYNAELAKRVREGLKSGKYDWLGIVK